MKPERLLWANNLRATATVAVIMLHVASTISSLYPGIPKSYLLTSIFFDSAVRWSVPVFIMLSGSFALENYDDKLGNFFVKMFYRIILPFLFLSVVYLFYFSWDELTDPGKSTIQLLAFIGKQFLEGTATHLWFVYIIISMYLTFPFLSKWTKVATEKEYIYFFVLWIFFLLVDPFLSSYDINFTYTYFTGFIGYIVLGNYLFKSKRRYSNLLLISLFLSAFFYTAIRTYFISLNENKDEEFFMDNLSLNIFVMSFCVYSIFKNNAYFTNSFLQKAVGIVCQYSYGIYLSHILVLYLFLWIGIPFYYIHPALSILLTTLGCLIVSCGLVYVLKKIPYLRAVAG